MMRRIRSSQAVVSHLYGGTQPQLSAWQHTASCVAAHSHLCDSTQSAVWLCRLICMTVHSHLCGSSLTHFCVACLRLGQYATASSSSSNAGGRGGARAVAVVEGVHVTNCLGGHSGRDDTAAQGGAERRSRRSQPSRGAASTSSGHVRSSRTRIDVPHDLCLTRVATCAVFAGASGRPTKRGTTESRGRPRHAFSSGG